MYKSEKFMQNAKDPSDKSRRSFLKKISSGIITTYVAAPNLKLDAQNLKDDLAAAIESKTEVNFILNGKRIKEKIRTNITLAELIREHIGLTGTKIVCNQGECGSCTVLIDNLPVYSCHMLAMDTNNTNILTIEGLLNGDELNEIQKSFVDNDGLQCGFCTPGQILTAYSLVKKNPKISDEEILKGMSGNICRCGAYPKILDSIKEILKKNI